MASAAEQLVVLVTAVGVTYFATLGARRIAPKMGAIVAPDDRHVHVTPTPTGGGAAMFLGLLVALALASRLGGWRVAFAESSEALAVVVGATVIFAVGALDDLRDVSAPAKVAGQVLAGSVMAVLGVTVAFVRVPLVGGIIGFSADWATFITVLLVVVVANAVNLIDGLDGLAAGTVAIGAAAVYLFATSLQQAGAISPNNIGPLLALVTFGICVGFLPHNLHPARIFMGDSGSMLLGLLMAAATMTVSGRVVESDSGGAYFFFAPAIVPALILGVPLIDSAWAVLRRALKGGGIATADKGHLHHRLMAMGYGHRRTVWVLWAWTTLLAAVALVPSYTSRGEAVLPFALVAAVALLRLFLRRKNLRRVATESEAGAADARQADAREVDARSTDQQHSADQQQASTQASADQ